MKRDMELVVKLLNYLEEKEDFITRVTPEIEGYSNDQVYYHLKLLDQAYLVEAEDSSDDDSIVWGATCLTNQGHDFIDSLKQESIWSTIKSEFKDASLSTIVSVTKQLAEGWAKKKVESLLNANT
jgi:hypothetical protein